jgi:hypothetical protein
VSIDRNHPYWHVANIVSSNPNITSLCFSYYQYVPQSIMDDRHIFYVGRDEFLSESWMENLVRSTPPGRELALHSKVGINYQQEAHIPMVDLSTTARAHLLKLQTLIEHTGFGQFTWFASGRSFHGYGNLLLTHEYWVKLMGALLLSNQKGMMPTVDPRWIGHRLLGGYSALRWTKNTSQYVNFPTILPPMLY